MVLFRRMGAIFSLHISHGTMKYLGSTRGVLTRETVVARSQTRKKLARDPQGAAAETALYSCLCSVSSSSRKPNVEETPG